MENAANLQPGRSVVGPSRLTRRELEVASLVTRGLTNAEIAAELVLSAGTVANHIAHIFQKLRLARRSQVAAWAVRQGLDDSARNGWE